jgi:hypothetical protein
MHQVNQHKPEPPRLTLHQKSDALFKAMAVLLAGIPSNLATAAAMNLAVYSAKRAGMTQEQYVESAKVIWEKTPD